MEKAQSHHRKNRRIVLLIGSYIRTYLPIPVMDETGSFDQNIIVPRQQAFELGFTPKGTMPDDPDPETYKKIDQMLGDSINPSLN